MCTRKQNTERDGKDCSSGGLDLNSQSAILFLTPPPPNNKNQALKYSMQA